MELELRWWLPSSFIRETGMRLTAYTDYALRVRIRLAFSQIASRQLRISQRVMISLKIT
jgi:hypothetical protein